MPFKVLILTSALASVDETYYNAARIDGATGAAIATASSYFACYAVRIFDARSYVKFKVSFLKLFVNMVVVCYMAFVAVKEPKLTYLQLIVLFVVMVIFNFEAILSTLRKILNRKSTK